MWFMFLNFIGSKVVDCGGPKHKVLRGLIHIKHEVHYINQKSLNIDNYRYLHVQKTHYYFKI